MEEDMDMGIEGAPHLHLPMVVDILPLLLEMIIIIVIAVDVVIVIVTVLVTVLVQEIVMMVDIIIVEEVQAQHDGNVTEDQPEDMINIEEEEVITAAIENEVEVETEDDDLIFCLLYSIVYDNFLFCQI